MNPADSNLVYIFASVCLALFSLLGIFDGVYFHLHLYKLHQHAEARIEHLLHTARAVVFVPLAYLLFVRNSQGVFLWLAMVFLVLDFILEAFDILVEKNARRNLGGISSAESLLHVFATGFKMAAVALVLSQKQVGDWSIKSVNLTESPPELPGHLQALGVLFLLSTLIGSVYHVWLMKKPRLAYRQPRKM